MTAPSITQCDVRGTAIKVMRSGSGSPLLLLRGTDASDDWLPYMSSLARHHDVIVPEHPGFGGKSMPDWLDCVSDLANFYLDLTERLNLTGLHLVGMGLGGWMAADLAHRCSKDLATLTLVGAAGLRVAGIEGADIFLLGEEASLRASFHDTAIADRAVVRMLSPETEDVRLSNAIAIARVAWNPRLHDPHLAKWLHRIKVPTSLIWGQKDRLFPRAIGEAYRDAIPGAILTTIPDCGHAVALERPNELVSTLLDFTSKHGERT